MTSDVTIGLAFVAGLISFISPCVLPLVPAYVGYMSGHMAQQVTQQTQGGAQKKKVRQRFGTFTHGLFFVLGFTLFFVVFGLLTTAAVSSLTSLGVTEADVRDGIARIGGTAVIIFGLHVMGILNRVLTWLQKQALKLDRNPYGNVISMLVGIALIGAIYWLFVESWFMALVIVLILSQVFRDALKADTSGEFWSQMITRVQAVLYVDTRHQNRPDAKYGYLGSLFMGVVFSAGWTPCIGPIYGAVLTLASSGGSISEAGTLLTAYSLGLGIPFLLTALALDQMQGAFRRLQRNMRMIEMVSGVFLVLIGVLVFSGQLERFTRIGTDQGSLGDISLNLENCVVGAVEGEVRWGNVPGCISNGLKDDFYITYPKDDWVATPIEVVEIPTATDAGSDLAVPDLAVPDLSPAPESDSQANMAVDVPVGLVVGQRAPDFSVELLDGRTVSLSDFRGQPVLVNFWATWCGPCRKEMPDFQTIYDIHKSDGFVVLAVNNMERKSDVTQFVDDLGVSFPVALDETGAINLDLYGSAIPGYPTSFLLDQNGVIVNYFPRIIEGSELLDALEDMLDG